MAMSTQTLAEGSRLLALNFLDTLQIYDAGDPETVGHEVVKTLTAVGLPVSGLVQTVTLENAVESRVTQTFSIKVPKYTGLKPGQVVEVLYCCAEPELIGKKILVDKVSKNGLAMIRKGTGSDFENVNQEGKP